MQSMLQVNNSFFFWGGGGIEYIHTQYDEGVFGPYAVNKHFIYYTYVPPFTFWFRFPTHPLWVIYPPSWG